MRCNNCGWENPNGSTVCEKCNAPLLDLRKGLSDISKNDSSPFRINSAMCYCQMPTDWGNQDEHLEHRRHVGWLINTKSAKYKLHEGRNIIGRDASCDISILDSHVSLKHAIVVFRNDKFSIMDNMSSWGTFVNGKDIESEKIELHDGDIIKVGETVLRFCSHVNDEHKESFDEEHNENEKI